MPLALHARRAPAGRSRRARAARRRASCAGSARTRPCRPCSARGRRRRSACDPAPTRAARRPSPSASTKYDASSPTRNSSSTRRSPAAPKRRSTIAARTVSSAVARSSAITTPLPAARPSAFNTTGIAELARRDRVERRVRGIADAEARRRHAVPRHEVLRERLARFERRGGLGRTDDRAPRGREQVDDAEAERQLGSDDGEIHRFALRDVQDRARVRRCRRARSARARRFRDCPGRRSPSSRRARAASFHAIACSRAPPPTTRIFMESRLIPCWTRVWSVQRRDGNDGANGEHGPENFFRLFR